MKNIINLIVLLSILFFSFNLWAQDFVVVKRKTKFYSTSSSAKPFLRSNKSKGFMTLQLIEQTEKRVRVRIAADFGSSCYSTAEISGLELDLWVDRKDLETVTTELLSRTFEDNSEIELAAGMVVRSKKIVTKTSTLKLDLKDVKTGFSFKKEFVSLGRPKFTNEVFVSKRGMKFDQNKYFRLSAFRKVEKFGDLLEVKNKCARVRGFLKYKKQKKTEKDLRIQTTIEKATPNKGSAIASLAVHPGASITTIKGDPIGKFGHNFRLSKKKSLSSDAFCQSFKFLKARPSIICVLRTQTSTYSPVRKKARIKIRMVKVTDGDSNMATKVIRRRASAFRYCYERELRINPKAVGEIAIEAVVGVNGKVKTVALTKSSMKALRVEQCSLKMMRRLRFMKSETEMSVKVRLRFRSE